MFNLHHLHYFYVCAQMGSVTRAAAKLGISQPSLSAQIKRFEEQIGMQILIRSGRSLTLTPRGRELFEYSARIFETAEQVERFIKSSERSHEFDLRFGVSAEVERPFVADVLGRLMKLHGAKKISSTIISGTHSEIVEMMADDQVDVIISNQKVAHATPVAEMKIPVVLATAAGARAVRGSNVQVVLEQLGQSLILPMPQMTLGKETRSFLKELNIKSFTSMQSNILACIVRAVEEGVGAAFLPIMYINLQIKRGNLRAIGPREGYWQHTLYLYSEMKESNEYLHDLIKILNDLNVVSIN